MRDTQFMGVLNVTPDSFSDGGRFFWTEDEARLEALLAQVDEWQAAGLEWVDVGGESTGPGSGEVTVEEELARVERTVRAIKARFPQVKVSVDTWKSEVAEAALAAGADMINDVTAGRGDARLVEVVASAGAPLVLMYSKDDTPRTTRAALQYDDVVATVLAFLQERVAWARARAVRDLIVDPGMGCFVSGDPRYSWELIDRIEEFHVLNCPILVGTSRKSFLGEDRFGGTLATSCELRGRVDYLRVHDALENATAFC